ncbi:MAG: tyrosine-type recombinase/integrase [Arcanobacterium sp.]|nr:tyrosine-type recombinase/integrase [Arcanobacterium sp.]
MSRLQKIPPPQEWIEALTGWELQLKAEGVTKETIRTQLQRVISFARNSGLSPITVSLEDILVYSGKADWQPETRHGYYIALRKFFSWFCARNNCPNPTIGLPTVKRNRKPSLPIPDYLLVEVIKQARPRDRFIFELAALCGLRAGEIAKVHERDLLPDLLGFSLVVHGKGNKMRIIPISAYIASKIREYAKENGGYCFPGKDDGHITPGAISKIGQNFLPKGFSLHALRHRYATTIYSSTKDLMSISQLLGHASVDTTQRYIAVSSEQLRSVMSTAQYLNPQLPANGRPPAQGQMPALPAINFEERSE